MPKTALIFVFWLVMVFTSHAQTPGVNIQFTAIDSTQLFSGGGVPQYALDITDSTASGVYYSTVYTDSSGEYTGVFVPADTVGSFTLNVVDCNHSLVFQRTIPYVLTGGQPNPQFTDSTALHCVQVCEGSAIVNWNNGTTYNFDYINHPSWVGTGAEWYFGDGQSASGATSISHTYGNTGIYHWRMEHYGCVVDSGTLFIGVNAQCEAEMIVDTFNSFDHRLVVWNVSQSSELTYTVKEYRWWFGDGDSSEAIFPTHHYDANGKYLLRLRMREIDPSNGSVVSSDFTSANVGMDANGDLLFKSGFTLNVMDTASIGLAEYDEVHIALFPSPSDGRVYWQSDVDPEAIEVFNASGMCLDRLEENNGVWDGRNQPPGIYFIRFVYKEHSIVKKCIVR